VSRAHPQHFSAPGWTCPTVEGKPDRLLVVWLEGVRRYKPARTLGNRLLGRVVTTVGATGLAATVAIAAGGCSGTPDQLVQLRAVPADPERIAQVDLRTWRLAHPGSKLRTCRATPRVRGQSLRSRASSATTRSGDAISLRRPIIGANPPAGQPSFRVVTELARRRIILGSPMIWCLVVDRAVGISQRHRRLMAPGRRRSG
jgi:hypothetical protein